MHSAPLSLGCRQGGIENIDSKSSEDFRLANKMKRDNADILGNTPARNDAGELSMSEEAKQKAYLDHYERLLNIEFEWDPEHLSDEPPVEGPSITLQSRFVW